MSIDTRSEQLPKLPLLPPVGIHVPLIDWQGHILDYSEEPPHMVNTDREHWAAVNRKWKRQQMWAELRHVAAHVVVFAGMVAVCAAAITGVLIIAAHFRMP